MNDTTILMTSIIYYSLFHKELIHDKNEITNFFPKNVFGVFSTVRRSHKIKSYPVDIHGCIGYWDTNFNNLNKDTLYNHLLRVSYDSVWTDNRNQYFTPIQTDPESMLELDFMLNPIYKINKTNGAIVELNTLFTNKIYGIIIQTKDKTQKATYLPNVFPNISWKKLVESIKQKANIISDDFDLFAYKITQIKSSFIHLLTNQLFRYICISNFSRLLIDNMNSKLKFPFMYSCKNNILEWNSSDDVRNISTLGQVFKYINLYPNIAKPSELKIIKQKILYILQNIDQYNSQSLSFLGYIYSLLNINNRAFCKKLLSNLPFAETEFEKPEIIIGLNNAGCIMNTKKYLPSYDSNDSIFKINWIVQATISANKKLSKSLLIILQNKIHDILLNIKNIETNYIAVAFECLCFVYKYNNKITILHKIFELLFELEQRKSCHNILYAFLDNGARIDITGHIMNGFIQFKK